MAKPSRILVVDDELGPREALRLILQDHYEISTAQNGHQALDYLSKNEFDLVILDIRMPDVNGIDLLAEVKKKVPETEVVMITAYASVDTAASALRLGALDYLIKPFDRKAVMEVVEKGLSRRAESRKIRSRLDELQLANKTLRREIEKAFVNIQRHYLETVRSLVAAIDAKDSYTKSHQERVVMFAMLLGAELGLSAGEIDVLRQAAVLHDIGKIGVPEQILRKPEHLISEEFDIIRQHPVIGAEIISPVRFLSEVVQIVLHHHERFDGTGYPDGLKGAEIPLGARILAVADAVDAMLSDRPYARARTVAEVREELRRCSGTQFDPQLVKIALKIDLPSRRIT
ncbi:response regulator receiver modulated metal dependent phosphohydrolase [Candidatus Desulforudis audaxviator MP104C]|uniref:Stage 0 sporulation protein A homolog n=1 Tax=Desulforudis audaxviator (strain MP104C) TaxID=477974 RepID=B1I2H5_DESAP|nr:response regulator receiver modulated metal dependent phosphohydrolase [Candidatus Desulforudis audaxviator MP104C]AZK59284.1 response regulator receiver modulated metal dependent phosphohydrolase [Candidatus Desulforudis audaxviator]